MNGGTQGTGNLTSLESLIKGAESSNEVSNQSQEQITNTGNETQVDSEIEALGSEVNTVEDSNQKVTNQVTEPETTDAETKNDSEEDWDTSEEVTKPTQTETVSKELEAISTALGLPFKDAKLIVDEVKNLKSQSDSFKSKLEETQKANESLFANDDLKQANEIAKNGGDYQEYLGLVSIDYNQIPDKTLFIEAELKQYFPDTEDGRKDMLNYIEGMPDADLKIAAGRIRKQLQVEQTAQKEKIKRDIVEKKKAHDESLRKALDSMDTISGFKVKPEHRRNMYEKFTSNQVVNDLFYNDQKQFDPKKAAEMYFKATNFDAIVSFLKKKERVEGKKELIKSTTNTNLNKTTEFASPEAKVKDPLMDAINKAKQLGNI
jgi:hypothetical protein